MSCFAILVAGLLTLPADCSRPQYRKRAALLQLKKGRSTSYVGSYEAFLDEFGRHRPHEDDGKFSEREALFGRRIREVEEQNSKPEALWKATVNKFTDYTDAELHAMLGYHSARRMRNAPQPKPASFFETYQDGEVLAESVDWRTGLNNARVLDQGECGSCWAVAAAGAIEAHVELLHSGSMANVSYQELVDCAPNPDMCGGTGGCDGSTPDLAFAYVMDKGLTLASEYQGYQTGQGECKRASNPSAVKVAGFVSLPVNELKPLLHAVATIGPVAVAADATLWYSYWTGVYNRCLPNAVVNHAILLMGYGYDPALKTPYWLIRNSWSDHWGEKGYIRMLRDTEEGAYCGVDYKPEDGVGCKNGPATLPVCGMCGILSSSAYPTGVELVMHQVST